MAGMSTQPPDGAPEASALDVSSAPDLAVRPASTRAREGGALFGATATAEGALEQAVFLMDSEGHILSWNPGVGRVLGYAREEWVGQDMAILFTAEDQEAGVPARERETARSEGQAQDIRWYLRKGGARFFADALLTPLYGGDGALIGFTSTLRVVDQSAPGLPALHDPDARLRLMADALPVLISYVDTELRYRFANRAYREWFDVAPGSLLGVRARDLVGESTFLGRLPYMEAALRGETVRFEQDIRDKDGRMRHTDTVYVPDRAEDGHVRGFFVLAQDITDRRRAEERERARLTDIFMSAPAFMAALRGPNHVFEVANPPFYRLIGNRDIIGKPVVEALPEVAGQGFVDLLGQVHRTGEPFVGRDVRVWLHTEPGGPLEERYVDFTYQPLFDEEGEVTGVLVHGVDLTERKWRERELRAATDALVVAEERLRLATQSADIGTWDFNPITGELIWDDRCRAAFGLEPGVPVNYATFLARLHPDDREPMDEAVQRALRGEDGGRYDVEYRTVSPADDNGTPTVRWVAATGRAFLGADGRAERFIGTALDITARKVAEAALREQTERFQAVARATRDAVWDWNLETDAVWWNEGICERFGYSPEQVGTDAAWWSGRIHAADRERVVRGIQAVIEGAAGDGHFWSDEYRFLRRDGTYAEVLDRGFVMREETSGRPLHMVGAILDLTERKRAEAALRAVHEQTSEILESVGDAFYAVDADFRFTYVNRKAEALWGRRREELIGKRFADEFPQIVESDTYRMQLKVARERQPAHYETVSPVIHRPVEVSVYPTASGGLSVYFRDISDRKALETERERLLAEARAWAEREALVNQIGEGIRQSLPPEEIEAVAVAALGRALAADRCYVFTVDATQDLLVIARDWHTEGVPSVAGQYLLSDLGVDIEALFGTGQTLVLAHLQGSTERLSDRNASANLNFQVSSLINVPFYEGDRIVGALAVAMASGRRDWTQDEVALAETVAGQLRSAVEAVRLQQRERTIAQQLQDALQPPRPPALPGLGLASFYLPALEEASVGGDFHDVFTLEKECTALVVADLSGKGLAAAQQVATMRNMLRFALYAGRGVADAITTLHYTLVQHNLITGFATLFVGVYDHAQRTLTYVNCGQEPGLVWRAATGEVESLDSTGPVLGAFETGVGFLEETVAFAPGDAFAVFTDGLSDAGPNRRNLLGIPGVSTLLAESATAAAELDQQEQERAQSMLDRLITGVEAYGRGGVRDDIALLVGVIGGDR